MNQIKKKLQSNAGASIILAFALTLICVMVASVVVAAAASGVTRNETELKKQQEYLAIASAAQYIAQNLNPTGNDRFCGVYLKNEKACSRYKNYVQSVVRIGNEERNVYMIPIPYASLQGEDLSSVDVMQFYLYIRPENVGGDIFCNESSSKQVLDEGGATTFVGIFKDMMKEAAASVYLNDTPYSKPFTISVDDTRIPDVRCTFKMDLTYQVTVLVESASGDSDYFLNVEMPAFSPIVDPYGWKTTEECKHECFYEYCDEVGNVKVSTIKESTFRYEVDNETTTITWGKPVIIKGGV